MKSRYVSAATLARIARDLKRHGITQDVVAAEAAKTSIRGHVTRSMVSLTLANRTKSANVVATARRLLAVAKTRLTGTAA